jgi:hypothetical protein
MVSWKKRNSLGREKLPPKGGGAYGIFVPGSDDAGDVSPGVAHVLKTKITRPGSRQVTGYFL